MSDDEDTERYQKEYDETAKTYTMATQEEYNIFQEDRNETMRALQQDKYKTKTADFNVTNYDVEELAAILNFKYVPLNEGIIKDRINHMKDKFRNKEKYIKFFTDVEVKLLENLTLFNKQTWEDAYKQDDSDAAKTLQNQFQELDKEDKENNNNHMLLSTDRTVVIGQRKLTEGESQAKKEFTQGTLNKLKKDTYSRIINFDSKFRQILPRVSYSCGNGTITVTEQNSNSEDRLYSATNYIAHLTEPLTNVVSIEIDTITIPKDWYVFTENYGTISFQVVSNRLSSGMTTISITEGNYDVGVDGSKKDLITALNNSINTNTELANYIEFSYNPINRKIDISNNDFWNDISLNWYIPDIAGSCGGNGAGSKVDYNLGWLLGYRTTFTTIVAGTKNIANKNQSTVDVEGTSYLFITLDDFNNNKPSNVVIAATEPITSGYKLPSYYNDQTMNTNFGAGTYYPGRYGQAGYECVDVADEKNDERGCGTADLNVDLRSNLTKQQVYSINQLKQAQSESSADRYGSPEPTDLLYTINNLGTDNWGKDLSYENPTSKYKREYFGPVKLTKFKIRLVNNKGYDVDLNGKDWQFTLRVTQMYQY